MSEMASRDGSGMYPAASGGLADTLGLEGSPDQPWASASSSPSLSPKRSAVCACSCSCVNSAPMALPLPSKTFQCSAPLIMRRLLHLDKSGVSCDVPCFWLQVIFVTCWHYCNKARSIGLQMYVLSWMGYVAISPQLSTARTPGLPCLEAHPNNWLLHTLSLPHC